MTVPGRIADSLEHNSSDAFCNRCLKEKVPLKKPQQADHATTGLAEARGPFHSAPCTVTNLSLSFLLSSRPTVFFVFVWPHAIDSTIPCRQFVPLFQHFAEFAYSPVPRHDEFRGVIRQFPPVSFVFV